ncbi:DUF3971 domain-containing protein [Halopseudomonas pachastrellae]|nr:DUF3971 domain-containing protein [Halopseudomonas pachastrellae]
MNTTGPLQLQVESAFDGSVSDALKLMQDSPLAELTGNPLAGWSGDGAVSGELQLTIPLRRSGDQAAQTQALVEWQLANAQVTIPVLQAPLEAIDGRFRFARGEGLTADTLSARFLGAPVEGQLTPLGERGNACSCKGGTVSSNCGAGSCLRQYRPRCSAASWAGKPRLICRRAVSKSACAVTWWGWRCRCRNPLPRMRRRRARCRLI